MGIGVRLEKDLRCGWNGESISLLIGLQGKTIVVELK